MLKKIVILILVVGLLGVLAATFMPKGADSDQESEATDHTDVITEQPTEDVTTGSSGSSSDVPEEDPLFDIPAGAEVLFDSRKTVFNTDIVDGVLYTQLDLAPEKVNHIQWYCDPALLPVIEAYGGAFEIGYTYDGPGDTIPTSDSNEWITVGSSATGQVNSFTVETYTVETGEHCFCYLYLINGDSDTDYDSIHVNGKLFTNFKFVIWTED